MHDLTYDELQSQFSLLNGKFASVNNANALYSLPIKECSPLVASITYNQFQNRDEGRPQLLISGEIHGDERVGPQVSLHLARLFVYAGQCEILKDEKSCLLLKDEYNLKSHDIEWLAFLSRYYILLICLIFRSLSLFAILFI